MEQIQIPNLWFLPKLHDLYPHRHFLRRLKLWELWDSTQLKQVLIINQLFSEKLIDKQMNIYAKGQLLESITNKCVKVEQYGVRMQIRLTSSESVSADSLGELEVSGHDGNSLGVDSAEVSVFEEGDEVSFGSFLESKHSGALESEFLLELVSDLADESLEGKFSDEEISGFLILPDFPKSDGSGFEAVGLLDSGGDGGALSGDFLSNELFSGHLLGGGLPCGLFCSSHYPNKHYRISLDLRAGLSQTSKIQILIGSLNHQSNYTPLLLYDQKRTTPFFPSPLFLQICRSSQSALRKAFRRVLFGEDFVPAGVKGLLRLVKDVFLKLKLLMIMNSLLHIDPDHLQWFIDMVINIKRSELPARRSQLSSIANKRLLCQTTQRQGLRESTDLFSLSKSGVFYKD